MPYYAIDIDGLRGMQRDVHIGPEETEKDAWDAYKKVMGVVRTNKRITLAGPYLTDEEKADLLKAKKKGNKKAKLEPEDLPTASESRKVEGDLLGDPKPAEIAAAKKREHMSWLSRSLAEIREANASQLRSWLVQRDYSTPPEDTPRDNLLLTAYTYLLEHVGFDLSTFDEPKDEAAALAMVADKLAELLSPETATA